jgi:hypothetical protein
VNKREGAKTMMMTKKIPKNALVVRDLNGRIIGVIE